MTRKAKQKHDIGAHVRCMFRGVRWKGVVVDYNAHTNCYYIIPMVTYAGEAQENRHVKVYNCHWLEPTTIRPELVRKDWIDAYKK